MPAKKIKKPAIKAAPVPTPKEALLTKELEEIKKLLEQIRDKPAPVVPIPVVMPIWVAPQPVYPYQPYNPWYTTIYTVTCGAVSVSGGLQGSSVSDTGNTSFTVSNFNGN